MNELIKKELKEIKIARISEYADDTVQILIPKGTRESQLLDFEKNRYYSIELADIILHPPDNFILHTQWNKGIIPKDKTLNVQVLDIMSNMVKISGTGDSGLWIGWIPKDLIKINYMIE